MEQQSKPKITEKDPVIVTEFHNPKSFSISPYYRVNLALIVNFRTTLMRLLFLKVSSIPE